ncbi:MAG: hypothetical protein ACI8YI_002258, partial [Paracoccaceae bacterium]
HRMLRLYRGSGHTGLIQVIKAYGQHEIRR